MLYSLLFLSYAWLAFDAMPNAEGLEHMLQDASCEALNDLYIEGCELDVVTTDESDDPCLQFHMKTKKSIGENCNFHAFVTLTDGAGEEQEIGISTDAPVKTIFDGDNALGKELSALANFPESEFPVPEGVYSNECHLVSDALLPKMLQRGLYTMHCELECEGKSCFKIDVSTEVM